MDGRIKEMFFDKKVVKKIQNKLPKLFHMAELECSRAGKVGMQVGSLRERIIVALLIYYFGEQNVESELPITEPEVDVKVFDRPISIKTLTSAGSSGIKIIWTVDAEKAQIFRLNYIPSCDIIFIRINWGNSGVFCYIPLEVQLNIFNELGRNEYVKLPKKGTNPRGVEFSSNAIKALLNHDNTLCIEIKWAKEVIHFNAFDRWVELWEQE